MQDEACLYDVFNSDIGREFFNNNLSLFPFGIHVIIPLLRVSVSSLLLKQVLIALNKYMPTSFQKNLKKIVRKSIASRTGIIGRFLDNVVFLHILSVLLKKSSLIHLI